jgi:D-3-phosphoglycerate dehydrogenase
MNMPRQKPKILVTSETAHLPEVRAFLEKHARVTYAVGVSDGELRKLIRRQDAIITNLHQKIDRKILDAASELKVIATPSTGTDHIDINYAGSKGVEVLSIKRDYDLLRNITSTAEHAFLLMLACLRKLPFAFDAVKRGEWDSAAWRGRELSGRTLGILGYGRLGEIFSRYAKAFGMTVFACDPYKKISDSWVRQVDMDTLLRDSEIITIHVHLTPETRGMIGAKEFSRMRKGICLVNTSRGALLDEKAFLRALKSGKIACAGIDVLANELDGRTSSDPLVRYARGHANLIITPHIGGCTYDAQTKSFMHTVRKLSDFFARRR